MLDPRPQHGDSLDAPMVRAVAPVVQRAARRRWPVGTQTTAAQVVGDKRRRIIVLAAAVAKGARFDRLVRGLVEGAAQAYEQARLVATTRPLPALMAHVGDKRAHESSGPAALGERMAALRRRITKKQQLA